MCDAAPGIIHLMDRMGVMFSRTSEGLLDFRRFGGTKHSRTAFAGATTGQQLLYALDEQVRRWEAAGLVNKYEHWEFLGAVVDDDGICRGVSAQDLRTMEVHTVRADAVILASGGPGIIFGKTTNSVINTGTAASAVYQQGVNYANGEFIQIHPTAIPGDDKLRLMSESARGEGGRIWTYKDGKPWYFLEEKYPAYGNLVPRDIATREIFSVCVDQKLGINQENMVYLDLSHKDPKELDVKLGGIIEIYEKFMGDDPRKIPMKIFPAVHYSMGGMWVDYNQMTNIPGLFAAGECEYQYHGANRLGANSLLSAIYGGMVAGPKAVEYIKGLKKSAEDVASSVFDRENKRQTDKYNSIIKMNGNENAYVIHKELGEWMTNNMTVVRFNDKLEQTIHKIKELKQRYKNININDSAQWNNAGVAFTRQLWNMLELSEAMTLGGLLRNESRGAHYKPDFPDRDDDHFMKSTIAKWTKEGPQISYEDIDVSLIKPRKRDYSSDKKKGE
jgi:succinate dehydrogenase / fumarate reductase flavoprotein subunit